MAADDINVPSAKCPHGDTGAKDFLVSFLWRETRSLLLKKNQQLPSMRTFPPVPGERPSVFFFSTLPTRLCARRSSCSQSTPPPVPRERYGGWKGNGVMQRAAGVRRAVRNPQARTQKSTRTWTCGRLFVEEKQKMLCVCVCVCPPL